MSLLVLYMIMVVFINMVYLIYGPPCSGKSTYISQYVNDNDLICDVDLIYSAISNHDPHDADLYIHEIALQLQLNLFNIIYDRNGRWSNAYVVSTANTIDQIKTEANRIKADKVVFMNTPYEICMERAKERPFYFQLLIEEWFATKDDNIDAEYINQLI